MTAGGEKDAIRTRRKSDAPSQVRPSVHARSTGRLVFGKRTQDRAADKAGMSFKDYLIAGGMAIGAAGIWFWNEIRN